VETTYSSVTKFYADLKAHLLTAGLTVEREVGDQDVIFTLASGFFRFQKQVVSPSVVAVGWAFGSDADVLAAQTLDAERCMPFAVTPGAPFEPTFHWYAPTKQMEFLVSTLSHDGRRYRVQCSLDGKWTQVFHEDRFTRSNEPNFKDTSAPYLPAGA
jgi:hypothetical protein